jgi:hypothetical protein
MIGSLGQLGQVANKLERVSRRVSGHDTMPSHQAKFQVNLIPLRFRNCHYQGVAVASLSTSVDSTIRPQQVPCESLNCSSASCRPLVSDSGCGKHARRSTLHAALEAADRTQSNDPM